MKKYLLLAVIVFLAACTTAPVEQDKDTVEVEQPGETPEGQAQDQEAVQEEAQEEEEPDLEEEESLSILRKEAVTNYVYSYSGRALDEFNNFQTEADYDASVKDNLEKRTYRKPQKNTNDTNYNEVYLDSDTKIAIGRCTSTGGSLCRRFIGQYFSLNYEDFMADFDPLSVMAEIPGTAQVVGSEQIANRASTKMEYPLESGTIVVYIDDFYSIPLRITTYAAADDELVVQSEYTFASLRIGSVKNADVQLPDDYNPETGLNSS